MSFDETFDVGADTGTPVTMDYDVPFKFTGTIEKVIINLGQTKLGARPEETARCGGRLRRIRSFSPPLFLNIPLAPLVRRGRGVEITYYLCAGYKTFFSTSESI